LPLAVWINPPVKNPTRQDAPGAAIVTPDDPQQGGISGPDGLMEDQPIVRINSVAALH
jgi:hypothetical protein